MRRSLRLFAMMLVIAGCTRPDDQRDLASALEEQFQTLATVRRSDSAHLMVILHGLPDTVMDQDSSRRIAFARSVAGYAKAHYSRRSELTSIGVVFVGTAQGQPVMVATQGNGPFRFASSELP